MESDTENDVEGMFCFEKSRIEWVSRRLLL
jgi:hypothetical protein